jgi:polysaccharide export outer membrane protein
VFCHQRIAKPTLKVIAMTKSLIETPDSGTRQILHRLATFILALVALATITGCQTEDSAINASAKHASDKASDTNQSVILGEGDVLKITFPGSPSLNTIQTIRNDGIISLPLVGEIKAAGHTPAELDQKLMDLYESQLTTKEVSVEVQSASFPIYVTGAVLRPGKIMSDHPITALEAVMEAGGFDYMKANTKAVVVIRKEAGGTKNYTLNLKAVMDGQTGEPFYLKPADIVFVQEKFNWF